MTKKEYLKKLRRRLFLRLPPRETAEIISDMEELFSAGADEGKNEEEIISALGSPRSAAAELLAESSVGERGEAFKNLLSAAGICIFALLLWALRFDRGTEPLLLLSPAAVWLLIEGKKFFTALSGRGADPVLLLCAVLLTAAAYIYRYIPLSVLKGAAALAPTAALTGVMLAVCGAGAVYAFGKKMRYAALIPAAAAAAQTAGLAEYIFKCGHTDNISRLSGSCGKNAMFIILLCCVFFFGMSVFVKSGSALLEMSLEAAAGLICFGNYRFLIRIDPMNVYIPADTSPWGTLGENVKIFCFIFTALSVIITVLCRIKGRRRLNG